MSDNSQLDSTRHDEWAELRERYLRPAGERAPSTARGLHHMAMISTDVAATIDFYQGVLGFPLTELFENRDYTDSTHFFFDIGNGNLLAFFDFPGLDLGQYAEVLGGIHHIAISMTAQEHATARASLEQHGIPIEFEHLTSIYLRGPDGERVELISDPLGHMYGEDVN